MPRRRACRAFALIDRPVVLAIINMHPFRTQAGGEVTEMP